MKNPRWCLMIMIMAIASITMVGGCDPEQIAIQADYQLTDPASQLQEGADLTETAATTAAQIVTALPIPGKAEILLGLAAVSGVCNVIQRLRGSTKDKVIRSIVQAIDEPGDTKTAVKSNLRAQGIEAKGREVIQTFREAA